MVQNQFASTGQECFDVGIHGIHLVSGFLVGEFHRAVELKALKIKVFLFVDHVGEVSADEKAPGALPSLLAHAPAGPSVVSSSGTRLQSRKDRLTRRIASTRVDRLQSFYLGICQARVRRLAFAAKNGGIEVALARVVE